MLRRSLNATHALQPLAVLQKPRQTSPKTLPDVSVMAPENTNLPPAASPQMETNKCACKEKKKVKIEWREGLWYLILTVSYIEKMCVFVFYRCSEMFLCHVLPAAAPAISSKMSPREEEQGEVMVSWDKDRVDGDGGQRGAWIPKPVQSRVCPDFLAEFPLRLLSLLLLHNENMTNTRLRGLGGARTFLLGRGREGFTEKTA